MNNTSKINNHIKHSTYKNESRQRKIIWFNPPFCKLPNINIGKYLLNLIEKHLKRDNP